MTADDGPDTLSRQRREADQRYNDALTALDAAVRGAAVGLPPVPDALERLTTPLIVFLQQITAFVETKDRELAAATAARIEQMGPAVEAIAELRSQVGALQRGVQMLTRERAAVRSDENEAAPPPTSSGVPAAASDHYKYVGFEDQFRGSRDAIQERLQAYVPVFAGCADVLDLGCGRGEFLAALGAAGISARGVDANGEMVAAARERGLEAARSDALTHLQGLPDGSLGGIIATQVVEHLEPPYLMRLLDTASHKLRQGAPIVIETINPACWLAFFSSYIRDFTHVRPVHPDTLQYLLRASGFERVAIAYSAPVPEHTKMKSVHLPAAVIASAGPEAAAIVALAHAVNDNGTILNNLMFTYLDYAAIAYRA